MGSEIVTVEQLQDAVADFRDARGWLKYHSPKRLMASVCIEAAELLETMQWDDDSTTAGELPPDEIVDISHEIADVGIYLLSLCNVLGIEFEDAVFEKMKINEEKYPC
jgi:NTP pyrophosphatase (non-canonical NTP hydrolase)